MPSFVSAIADQSAGKKYGKVPPAYLGNKPPLIR